jgi:hypothetical protein
VAGIGTRKGETKDNGQSTREKVETEGITIRLDKRVLRRLRHEAKEKKISTNVLISQIFSEHLEWHSTAARAGFVAVRRGTILKLLENTSEEEIATIAKFIGTRESKDFVLLLRHEYSLSSAMDVIETWIRISGYSYDHEVRQGMHSLVIHHDMGKKWSIYLSEIYKSVFEEFGQTGATFTFTDNTVHIRYDAT